MKYTKPFLNHRKRTFSVFQAPLWILLAFFLFSCADSAEKKTQETPAKPDKNIIESETADFKVLPEYQDKIDQLLEAELIKKAFNRIEEVDKETVQNQIDLTELEAPPFKEGKFGRTELFKKLMEKYGIKSVEIDSVGNVVGTRKGTKGDKVIVIAGHLDTVFPEGTDVTATISNDTIYAPGISDDGRGIAAVLTLARIFQELDVKTEDDILFVGNVGEEGPGDLRGMKHLFGENGPKIDKFISIEPGSPNRITYGGIGSHRYEITIEGPGGHSWGAFGLANPIHALGQGITEFVKVADAYTQDGEKTSYNVGIVNGGTSVNSVPFSVTARVDMRSLDQERLNHIDSLLHQSMRKGVQEQNDIRRRGKPLKLTFNMIGDRPFGKTDLQGSLVQNAAAASHALGAEKVGFGISSTDSNIPMSKGIPAITIGGGGKSGGAHSLDEWFLNEYGYKGIQRAFLLLASEAGFVNNSN